MSVAVLGAGSWGTTVAQVIGDTGTPVCLWARDPQVCADINTTHCNPKYTGAAVLPDSVRAETSVSAATRDVEVVVVAVPAQSARAILTEFANRVPSAAIWVSAMKGIEQGSGCRMSQVLTQVLGLPSSRVAVVSGPNLAAELRTRHPTAVVVASSDAVTVQRLLPLVTTYYLRPYPSNDVVGVEIGGAAKNVLALAVGIAQGLGFGDNTRATLLTRGLAETTRLAVALGAQATTLAGLAGVGDAVATCTSTKSRNLAFGVALGQSLTAAQASAQVKFTAEGVQTCGPLVELARQHGVELPIAEHLLALLDGQIEVSAMAQQLLDRPIGPEM